MSESKKALVAALNGSENPRMQCFSLGNPLGMSPRFKEKAAQLKKEQEEKQKEEEEKRKEEEEAEKEAAEKEQSIRTQAELGPQTATVAFLCGAWSQSSIEPSKTLSTAHFYLAHQESKDRM